MYKFIDITTLSKKLNLINNSNKKPRNYILRYWEKEFSQIKPKIINNRRYYSPEQVEIIKLINFLLKDKGLTIKGAKNILKSKINNLDDYNAISLKTEYYKGNLKNKSKLVLEKIRKLKKYGKKNTY